MEFQVTVRFRNAGQRYHTLRVEAEDATHALRAAADGIPADIAPYVDLVELRVAVDPERRAYLGEEPTD